MQSIIEEIVVLLETVMNITIPMEESHKMAFIGMNKKQDLIAHVFISPPHVNFATMVHFDF